MLAAFLSRVALCDYPQDGCCSRHDGGDNSGQYSHERGRPAKQHGVLTAGFFDDQAG